jgi:hypothetical protein
MPKFEGAIAPADRTTTVKVTPLLAVPFTVTITLPVVAPEGTFATIEESFQPAIEAVVPLKVTEEGIVPKFDPAMVTEVPATPVVGDRLEMLGGPDRKTFGWAVPPPQADKRSKSMIGTDGKISRNSNLAPEQAGVK